MREVNYCMRTYYPARVVSDESGSISIVIKPIKTISVLLANGDLVRVKFDEPKTADECEAESEE